MIQLNDLDNIYISEELAGYTKKLTQDGVFARQVDLLLLGFAYAVNKHLQPPERVTRHELVRVGSIDRELKLAIEAAAHWYVQRLGFQELSDEKKLLDFICRLASKGVETLRKEWDGKSKSQVQLAMLRYVGS